jgi:uncharacterized protein with GYD domain
MFTHAAFRLFDTTYPAYRVFMLLNTAIAMFAALLAVLTRTRVGLIILAALSLTDAGVKAAKDSPRRLDAAKKLLTDMGGEMKQFYMVMGDFDFVGICEAPDDAVMARYVLQLGGFGFVRTKTLKAFPETAYREIIRSLG